MAIFLFWKLLLEIIVPHQLKLKVTSYGGEDDEVKSLYASIYPWSRKIIEQKLQFFISKVPKTHIHINDVNKRYIKIQTTHIWETSLS